MEAMTQAYDAIVIGSGIAGFAAALSLKERGKNVAVLSRSVGATAVSSGAWDFGDFNDARAQSAAPLIEVPFSKQLAIEAAETTARALQPDLHIQFDFEAGLTLPTSAGTWKRTLGAQRVQAGADFRALAEKKVGLLASRSWRFRADLVASGLGEKAAIEPAWLDIKSPSDIPLPHVATRLAFDEKYKQTFIDAVKERKTSSRYDVLLAPPIFLDGNLAEDLQISELLATVEPVAGDRLSRAIMAALARNDIPVRTVKDLRAVTSDDSVRRLEVLLAGTDGWATFSADKYVLASGKFFGGGVMLGYDTLAETVFDLPLFVSRTEGAIKRRSEIPWGDAKFNEAQAWAQLGVWVDEKWRPIDESKDPVLRNVVACGSVIGGSDFARQGFGIGFMAFTGRQCGNVAS